MYYLLYTLVFSFLLLTDSITSLYASAQIPVNQFAHYHQREPDLVIIINFEGVLLESGDVFFNGWRSAVSSHLNINLIWEELSQYIGLPSRTIAHNLFDNYKKRYPAKSYNLDKIIREVDAYYANNSSLIEPNFDGLAQVKSFSDKRRESNILLVLSSLLPHKKIKHHLTCFDTLVDSGCFYTDFCFDYIFSWHDDLLAYKGELPPGAYYQHIRRILQVPSSKCVVIEASEYGMNRALDARMKVVIIENNDNYNHDFSRASLATDNWTELTLGSLFQVASLAKL